ncbi:hypothetical protein P4679_22350 [Priestia megaterium]|uniref:hypothetical protein n=1 Tax=Priestia megaterium TaxID=1404 RepID=UPI002E224C35|nr:hypothetical protein [Priestia megaterium]
MKRMLEEAKKADFNSMNKETLVSVLYFSEGFYTAAKELIKVVTHIIAYFLAMTVFAISCCFFESYIENIPLILNVIIRMGTLFYTIFLISRGIKLYLKYEAFLKILLQYILTAKMTLNKKKNNEKVSC